MVNLSPSHTNFFAPVFPLDPDITVQVTDGGAHQIAGLSYILTCTIILNGADNFNITYKWRKGATVLSETGSTLSFSALRLSDAGPYACEVSVSSVYLAESITTTSNILNVSLQSK